MRAPPLSPTGRAGRAAQLIRSLSAPETVVLAASLPILFLHVRLQPKVTLPLGSDGAEIALSDLAVLAVAIAAVRVGRRLGFAPLRRAPAVTASAALLLVAIAVGTLHPVLRGEDYAFLDHALTAAKFAEYALLAASVPLLVRTRADLRFVVGTLVVWSGAAAAVAVLQFLGALPEFRGFRPGEREPSFLGHHDLAALAGAAGTVALAALALGPVADLRRGLLWTAGIAGVVGLVLSGALAGFLGFAVAGAAALALAAARGVLTARNAAAVGAIVALTGAGVVAQRAENIGSFLRFVGIERARDDEDFGGESYPHRLALAYIGARMFADAPVLGVGWQASGDEWAYAPYLDDTRRRYPKLPELSLPSPEHPWGIQNGYLQAAAELGVAGAAAFFAALLVPIAVAWRTARRAVAAADASLPLLWLLVTAGVWLGLGIVAGIPLVALQWIAVGLAVAGTGAAREG